MQTALKLRHRVLVDASTGYQRADQVWKRGLVVAATYVPGAVGHGYWPIGNPDSRVRRLYEERDKALHRLNVALIKLKAAKARLEQTKKQKHLRRTILLLSDK